MAAVGNLAQRLDALECGFVVGYADREGQSLDDQLADPASRLGGLACNARRVQVSKGRLVAARSMVYRLELVVRHQGHPVGTPWPLSLILGGSRQIVNWHFLQVRPSDHGIACI